jgi:cyclohexanecarboxylate-CoA ligase
MDTTLTAERIHASTAAGFWRGETLASCLDRWARTRPARTAVVDAVGRLSYAALARGVERVAHALRAHGVEAGRVVSCQLPNWNEFVLVALAATRLGAVIHPIPPTYRAHELRFMLGLLESQVLVVPGTFRGFDYPAMVAGLRGTLPRLEQVIVVRGPAPAGMLSWTALTDRAWEARAGRRPLPGTDPNAVHEIVFTSGTTGEPKGVMHTSNTLLATLPALAERLRLTGDEVLLMASTLGHQTGYGYGLALAVLLGGTAVWMDVWDPAAAAALVERERVTFTMGATPFLRDLTQVAGRRDLTSLRAFIAAGAPIPRALVGEARRRLECAISAGWGMTENGLVTCNGLEDPEDKIFATDGAPLPGMEVRVVDGAGRDVGAGAEGDLLVRGPALFVGYARRPGFTAEAHTPDGWFRTGDRATLDRDGYVTITGRTKDLVIRGGENVPVAEVEGLLYAHPKLAGVAIVAMPDPRLGERACAVVIPRPGHTVTLAELVAFLERQGVARYKFPERLEVVAEFPTTPSGKVQKYRLRELVAARVAAERGRAGEAGSGGRVVDRAPGPEP